MVYGSHRKPGSAFSELKNYLYQLLLTALNNYDEKSTPALQMDRQLQNAKVLLRRGHYVESTRIVDKVKSKAKAHEDWLHLLEALQLEQKEIGNEETALNLESIQETQKCLEKLENLKGFQNLYYHLVVSARTYAFLREKDKKEKLDQILQRPIFQDKEWKSNRAKLFYFWIIGLYYYSTLDYSNFYSHSKITFELAEQQYKKTKDYTEDYTRTLGNFIMSLGLFDRVEEIDRFIPKYYAIQPSSFLEKESIFLHYTTYKNAVIIYKGDFKDHTSFFKQQKEEMKKFELSKISQRLFAFQFFKIHFGLEEYQKSLDYLEQNLELLDKSTRKDRQYLYPFYHIIIHFELKNYQLLESLSRSLYRKLKKEKKLFGFEKCLFRFIAKALKAANRQELREAFIWLSDAFNPLQSDPKEAVIFKYFPIHLWVESKIQNRSFTELIQETYREKSGAE